jgi:ABC-type multidrug transport system permease subunit
MPGCFLIVLLVLARITGRPVLLSPLAIFAFPAAVLAATSFSALFVCITTFVRKIEDFDIVIGLAVMPMFLFSGTFFPVSRVPLVPRIVIECLPLYHGTGNAATTDHGCDRLDSSRLHVALSGEPRRRRIRRRAASPRPRVNQVECASSRGGFS